MQELLDQIKSEVEQNQGRLSEIMSKFADNPVHAAQYNLMGLVKLQSAIEVKRIVLEQAECGNGLPGVVEDLISRVTRKIMSYQPMSSTCLVSNAIDQYNRSADLEVLEWLKDLRKQVESEFNKIN